MLETIILLLAGIFAGIITGLVGASAVMVAAPLLIVFLDYPAYLAIGIALCIDAFSSLSATLIYRHRIRIQPSLILLVCALVSVVIGSHFSKYIPSDNLESATGIGIMIAGLMMFRQTKFKPAYVKYKTASLIIVGLLIGAIAGAFGAGGGIMILTALVLLLSYRTHEAIGTSVFLMIFIASLGGLTHYINMPFSMIALLIGAGGGIIGAIAASTIANELKEKNLKKVVGLTIIMLGLLLVMRNIWQYLVSVSP